MQVQPVDLVHLSRRTAGDDVLEQEVLTVFVQQCGTYLDRLHRAPDREARKAAAHALVGSARAVGAFDLADAAQALEAEPSRDCAALDEKAALASQYVAGLLQRAH